MRLRANRNDLRLINRHSSRLFAARLVAFALTLFVASAHAATTLTAHGDTPWVVYDADPRHPWNRVFHLLYDMTDSKGERGWPDSLLHGQRHKKLVAALDAFLQNNAQRRIGDPVKRALFQHDLWMVFNWTLANRNTTDEVPAEVALQKRLVRIMRRVALSQEEIARLPDTYATAVASAAYPAAYQPARRDAAFLPADLLNLHGPWVLLNNNSQRQPAALIHSSKFGAHSDFFVLISSPGGREPTLRLLKQLQVFSFAREHDIAARHQKEGVLPDFVPVLEPFSERSFFWIHELLPVGTTVALVRRMRVLDESGYDHATPIVESVQLRVYREPNSSPQYAPSHHAGLSTGHPIENQDVFMFRVDRKALAKGSAASFVPVGIDDFTRDPNFINGTPPPAEIRPPGALPSHGVRVVDSCGLCHSGRGFSSFMTFARALYVGDPLPTLKETLSLDIEERSGQWVQGFPLGYLRAMWDSVAE